MSDSVHFESRVVVLAEGAVLQRKSVQDCIDRFDAETIALEAMRSGRGLEQGYCHVNFAESKEKGSAQFSGARRLRVFNIGPGSKRPVMLHSK